MRNSHPRPVAPRHPTFILLYTTTANRQLVAKRCQRAAAQGVRPGMTLAHARALLSSGDLCVCPYTPQRDDAALRALAEWANRFSPIVAVDPPDGLLMEISGCQRLFDGEDRLLRKLIDTAGGLGVRMRAATASTFGCAWAAARFGDRNRVEPGEERAALAPLPVEALRIDDDTIEALHELAIDRVGHLLELPRDELTVRFGDDLLLRMDQALGQALEAIDPVRAAPLTSAERILDGPTRRLEAILLVVRGLVGAMTGKLRRRECGVVQLELVFDRVDAASIRHTLSFSHPSRDEKHLWALLKPKAESTNLGYGVERVALVATATRRLAHEQGARGHGAVEDQSRCEQALGQFIDSLSGRRQAALQAELVESHIPERAFRFDPASPGLEPRAPRLLRPRPTMLFDEPQPIHVIALAPDGPPTWVRWRHRTAAVITSIGPERIAWEWWRPEARSSRFYGWRDYYAIQDEHGRWLWVYRHLPANAWFVHGQWA